MKKLYILIPIIIVGIIAVTLVVLNFQNKLDKLIDDENVQVDTLINIYKDIIEKNSEKNIILDESALKNMVTRENFKEENILKLKNVENKSESSEDTYLLQMSYSKHFVTVTIISNDGKERSTGKYKLYIKDKKVEFELKEQTDLFNRYY